MLNIDKPGSARPPTEPGFIPRVLDGAGLQPGIARLEATMAMLEGYVDSMTASETGFATTDGPPMDSWIDDIDLELRVMSL
jgi:hypothetical protein